MKIAIIGSRGYPYVYGGYETVVKELGERLTREGIEVHVYCQKNLFTTYPDKVNGIHLHYIPTINTKSLNQIVHCFLAMLHVTFTQVDVILVVNLAAGPLGWLPKLRGKKTMISTDGLEWLRPKWKGIAARYFRFAAKLATRFYDQIIADADEMKRIYLQEFNAPSVVIAYGAPEKKAESQALINRFGLTPQEYYLIVGRLIPDNNADLIIKGFLESASTKKLIIVGDVPYKDTFAGNLKKLKHPNLVFLGHITNHNELLALYQHCYVYLHGHQYGGTNPAMLKAMSNDCAILALNTAFNREMLDDGRFGLFFEHCEESVSESINQLENDPLRIAQLRTNVSKGLTDKYNWDCITQAYIAVMMKLLNPAHKK